MVGGKGGKGTYPTFDAVLEPEISVPRTVGRAELRAHARAVYEWVGGALEEAGVYGVGVAA